MKKKDSTDQIKAPNDLIVYTIGRLYVLLNQYLTESYREFGLNPAKFNLLMHIKHIGKEEGISQIELGSGLYVSAANITKLIDGLEKKGWVVREPFRDDRRVNLIKITAQGSRLLDQVWLKHAESLNGILREFSSSDKKKFNEFLDRFRGEMEKRVQNE